MGRRPATVGLNLRLADLDEIEAAAPPVGFWEVVADNLLDRPAEVERIAALGVPVSLHCVGMNLAGLEPLDTVYLDRVAQLAQRLSAVRVSDHLCWQHHGGVHHHDLLPFPLTEASTERVVERVDAVQQRLGRAIAVENLSSYVQFAASDWSQADVLGHLTERTGCGLLLDLCNLEVDEHNFGTDACGVLDALPLPRVVELHVAGPLWRDGWCIDAHGTAPSPRQWAWAAERFAEVPVCYERDQHRPPLAQRVATLHG